MAWIIRDVSDESLCWSNQYGWTQELFDTFSERERESLAPPIGGEWVQVPWTRESDNAL